MATFPSPGGSKDTWGDELLEALLVEHLMDGTHNTDAIVLKGIFGASTNIDSTSDPFEVAHAYSAPTDGVVSAWITGNGSAPFDLKGYVGATNDPAGAGIMEAQVVGYVQEDYVFITFVVSKSQFWEVTRGGNRTYIIRWRAIGTLIAPVDQEDL